MARLGRSASAKPQLCSRTLLHLLRSPLGTSRQIILRLRDLNLCPVLEGSPDIGLITSWGA